MMRFPSQPGCWLVGTLLALTCVLPAPAAEPEGEVPTLDELHGEWYAQSWCGVYLREDEDFRLTFHETNNPATVLVGHGQGAGDEAVRWGARPVRWDAEAGVLELQHDIGLGLGDGRLHVPVLVTCRLRGGVLFLTATHGEGGSACGAARLTREPLGSGATRRARRDARATAWEAAAELSRVQRLYLLALEHAEANDGRVPGGLGELLNAVYAREQEQRANRRGGLGGGGLDHHPGGLGGGRDPDARPDAYDNANVGWLMRRRTGAFGGWSAERRAAWVDANAEYVLLIAGRELGENYPRLDHIGGRNPGDPGRRGNGGLIPPRGRPAPGGLNPQPRRTDAERREERERRERELDERRDRERAQQAEWAAAVVLFELPRRPRQRVVSVCFGDGRVLRMSLREADALLREQTGTDLDGWLDHLDRGPVDDDELLPLEEDDHDG